MKYLECDNYTVVLWNWIHYELIDIYVYIWHLGMWRNFTSHYILTDLLLLMSRHLFVYM